MSSLNPPFQQRLAENIKRIQGNIAEACGRSRRHPENVTLVVVTKSVGIEIIRQLLDMNINDLGESRVQDLTQRAAMVAEGFARRSLGGGELTTQRPKWHLVGHLQRNKVKSVIPWAELIHSVDSLRLGEEIDALAARLNRKVHILIQVNSADEAQKFGVAIGAATHLAEQFASLPHIVVRGLMCMAPLGCDAQRLRAVFSRTREVFDEIRHKHVVGSAFDTLSMGMSDDYEVAVECGSTLVRVGRAAFGGLNPDEEAGAESADKLPDAASSTIR